jgi:beta-N-acetylhexosaminidase
MSRIVSPGVFFIFGFNGIIPQDDFLGLIDEHPPAGFLLLENNFRNPDQLASLISRLRSLVDGPCLFAVDQEPGRVQRFKNGFSTSKMPLEYLKDESIDNFREWCLETANVLRSAGINMNLAPVVDMLPVEKKHPVLKDRTFGDKPGIVSAFAGELIEAHKKKSVLTCAKHFPGLGSAINDPHLALAVSDDTIERFRDYHWRPFLEAVKLGVSSIMTTHLLAGAVDDRQCATYSAKTIRYLRQDIGHSGPIITDDLLMRGAGAQEKTGDAAINAVESGHNFVIISGDIDLQRGALKSVANRLIENELFERAAIENEKILKKILGEIK